MSMLRYVGLIGLVGGSFLFAGGATTPVKAKVAPVADDNVWIVALKSGTLGLGVDLTRPLNDYFAVRLNANGLRVHGLNIDLKKYIDVDIDGVDTLIDIDYLSLGGLLDWHPFKNSFLVSVGAYYSDNTISGIANATGKQIVFEGNQIKNNVVDTITSTLSANHFAPYAGIGYSNISKSGWGFTWDMGVMYQGTPKIKTTVKPMPAGVGTQDLRDVEQIASDTDKDANKKIADYAITKFYPVVRMGIQYSF